MKKLFLFRGLPGSGKSTRASAFRALLPNLEHYEADMYFLTPEGEYIYDPSLSSEAHSWCRFAVECAMERGLPVAVANTFVRLKDLDPYFELARKNGYVVEVTTCRGQWPSVHNVPPEVIERMRRSWEEFE